MRPGLIDLGPWRYPAYGLVLAIVCVLVVLPLFSVIAGSLMTRFGFFDIAQPWTIRHWQKALGDSVFLRSLSNTLIIAFTAGLVGPMIFSFIAYVAVRTNLAGRGLLNTILWMPTII